MLLNAGTQKVMQVKYQCGAPLNKPGERVDDEWCFILNIITAQHRTVLICWHDLHMSHVLVLVTLVTCKQPFTFVTKRLTTLTHS